MSGKRNKISQKLSSTSLAGSKDSSKEVELLKQNEVVYKSKIRALEVEGETLRYRLDSLRKAKSTTIVRREREEIKIATPNFGNHVQKPHPPLLPLGYQEQVDRQLKALTSRVEQLTSELSSEKESHKSHVEKMEEAQQKEVRELKEAHAKMADTLSQQAMKPRHDKDVQVSKSCADCEAAKMELSKLRTDYSSLTEHLEGVLATNEALRKSSLLLQERSATLLEELSVKEAEWSLREEKLQAAITEQWGRRYHEWIAKAEKKMAELQEVNTYLQQTMKKM